MKKVAKKIKDVSEVPGVGEKIAEKIKEAGYIDLMSLAAASSKEIAETASIGEATAVKIIAAARDALDIGYETADKVMERREIMEKITTGSKNFDTLLGGGIETLGVTEAFGEFASGKSQLAFQLAVNVQLPKERGGLEGKCMFIDTEGTFRPERIKQIAEGLGLDPMEVLRNIIVARAYNSDHQVILAEKAGEIIQKENIKLLIVDSITSAFRGDFTGRGTLAERQQRLNRHLHTLKRLADVYKIAIYYTNQVMSKPDVMYGDPTRPIGGHIIGHFADTRLYLRKSKGETRIAKVKDSPSLPEGEAVFLVTPTGLKDPEE
ncbi:MAG: DNA repair and recombination protein RadA [Candidatus Aenigmarchaeota archaeon]|nr:DNA repair and recombination protein RadA [Candidatus Aenigmarchaeota archaeon]